MDDFAHAYLKRIGLYESPPVSTDGLVRLHRAHLRNVPFECLDVFRGRSLSLSPDRLFDKVVNRRRGGFCYELNTLFALLLRKLGFPTTLLSAGVMDRKGVVGPDFDHMTLRVEVDGPWLCDVGFGRSFLEPLPLREGQHVDPEGRFRLRREESKWWLERYDSDEPQSDEEGWRGLYRFDLVPRLIDDFREMFQFHQSSKDSPFPQTCIVSQATEKGRVTLREFEIIETVNERRFTRQLESEDARRTFLRERFGLNE